MSEFLENVKGCLEGTGVIKHPEIVEIIGPISPAVPGGNGSQNAGPVTSPNSTPTAITQLSIDIPDGTWNVLLVASFTSAQGAAQTVQSIFIERGNLGGTLINANLSETAAGVPASLMCSMVAVDVNLVGPISGQTYTLGSNTVGDDATIRNAALTAILVQA